MAADLGSSFVTGVRKADTPTRIEVKARASSRAGFFLLFHVLPGRTRRTAALASALVADLRDIKGKNGDEGENILAFHAFSKNLATSDPHRYSSYEGLVPSTRKALRMTAEMLRLFVRKTQEEEENELRNEMGSFMGSINEAAALHMIDPRQLARFVLDIGARNREPKEHDHRVWAKLSFSVFGRKGARSGALESRELCIEDFDLIKREKLVDVALPCIEEINRPRYKIDMERREDNELLQKMERLMHSCIRAARRHENHKIDPCQLARLVIDMAIFAREEVARGEAALDKALREEAAIEKALREDAAFKKALLERPEIESKFALESDEVRIDDLILIEKKNLVGVAVKRWTEFSGAGFEQFRKRPSDLNLIDTYSKESIEFMSWLAESRYDVNDAAINGLAAKRLRKCNEIVELIQVIRDSIAVAAEIYGVNRAELEERVYREQSLVTTQKPDEVQVKVHVGKNALSFDVSRSFVEAIRSSTLIHKVASMLATEAKRAELQTTKGQAAKGQAAKDQAGKEQVQRAVKSAGSLGDLVEAVQLFDDELELSGDEAKRVVGLVIADSDFQALVLAEHPRLASRLSAASADEKGNLLERAFQEIGLGVERALDRLAIAQNGFHRRRNDFFRPSMNGSAFTVGNLKGIAREISMHKDLREAIAEKAKEFDVDAEHLQEEVYGRLRETGTVLFVEEGNLKSSIALTSRVAKDLHSFKRDRDAYKTLRSTFVAKKTDCSPTVVGAESAV